MKTKTSKRTLIIRIAAVVLLIAIGYWMAIIGRGHTIYLDNKTFEYDGKTYDTPYKVVVSIDGEETAKLYDRERGSVTCIGQKLTMTLEITQEKGGSETTETYTIAIPRKMDGVIINLPAYLAGLDEDAYMSEFIPSPDSIPVEDDVSSDDEFGMTDMEAEDTTVSDDTVVE